MRDLADGRPAWEQGFPRTADGVGRFSARVSGDSALAVEAMGPKTVVYLRNERGGEAGRGNRQQQEEAATETAGPPA